MCLYLIITLPYPHKRKENAKHQHNTKPFTILLDSFEILHVIKLNSLIHLEMAKVSQFVLPMLHLISYSSKGVQNCYYDS